jgi:hypothetical protein
MLCDEPSIACGYDLSNDKGNKMRGIILMVSLVSAASAALANPSPEEAAAITKAVAYCVDVVHKSAPNGQNFDAFYNPSTGMVQNNANTVGEQKALFVFQKCMAQQGVSLKN